MAHEIVRIRRDVVFRRARVSHIEPLTPHMRRIHFASEELVGFDSPAPDDHIKIMLPEPTHRHEAPALPVYSERGIAFPDGATPMSPPREYTPRAFDTHKGELTIDFVLHGEGPAASWAAQARPGDWLVLGGPRGSRQVPTDFDHYVFIGDETALPAIGRWIESLPSTARATVIAEIPEPSDRQRWETAARVETTWLARSQPPASGADSLCAAAAALPVPSGDTYVWIAAESTRVRQLRTFFTADQGWREEWVQATGYWKAHDAKAAD